MTIHLTPAQAQHLAQLHQRYFDTLALLTLGHHLDPAAVLRNIDTQTGALTFSDPVSAPVTGADLHAPTEG